MNALNTFARWVAIASLALFAMAQPAAAADGRGPLVSVEWLKSKLGSGEVQVLDASSSRLYAAKHIPGAVSVDLYRYGAPHKVTVAEMEKRIQSWGVSPGRKVVVYDEGAGNTATWLFYELYYHGFPPSDLFVLDGGLAKWEASGGPVTKDPTPSPAKGTFRVAATREEVRARFHDFLTATGDTARFAVVDALEPTYHYGGQKFFDRGGHIPNALLAPVPDFYNADKTFKSPEEIRRMSAYLGIRPEQEIHTHCGGGVAATVPFFAMKFLAGYPNVKVYKESQLEWLQDPRGLPFWTYAAPNIKRDAAWLNSWNSRMMRMYGVSQLSVIDVRPAQAYDLNHVPFAVNIPAEVFKRHLDDPAALARILGEAGVDPAHEAVIVSAAGVDPDAALAFVALEKLGHKKISILAESVDEWGMKGFPLTKQRTLVGQPKSPQDDTVPPASYAAQPRPGVVVRHPGDAPGLYPRVFLASGKAPPKNAPEGKVVHVPYSDLVMADGSPKPAHEIWQILSKAGVPRYADIVLLGGEPGEAAVSYFVLRMMGYPDVKLLQA